MFYRRIAALCAAGAALFVSGILIVSSAYAQITTKEVLIDSWKRMADYTIAIAQLMPAEHYAYKPVPEIRSFGEQMQHISQSNRGVGRRLLGGESKAPAETSKEGAIRELRESFDFVAAALKKITFPQLEETMEFIGSQLTRFQVLQFYIDHHTHTRGIALMYLRMKGIAPPAFQSWVKVE